MNSDERILLALNMEISDRIPTYIIAIDGNQVDKIIGAFPKTAFDLIKDLQDQFSDEWLEKLNSILSDLKVSIFLV